MLNTGMIDRGARVAFGLVLLALVFFGPHTRWGLLGLIPLVTGIIGFCPLYLVFGVDTCSRRTPTRPPVAVPH